MAASLDEVPRSSARAAPGASVEAAERDPLDSDLAPQIPLAPRVPPDLGLLVHYWVEHAAGGGERRSSLRPPSLTSSLPAPFRLGGHGAFSARPRREGAGGAERQTGARSASPTPATPAPRAVSRGRALYLALAVAIGVLAGLTIAWAAEEQADPATRSAAALK